MTTVFYRYYMKPIASESDYPIDFLLKVSFIGRDGVSTYDFFTDSIMSNNGVKRFIKKEIKELTGMRIKIINDQSHIPLHLCAITAKCYNQITVSTKKQTA